MNIDVKPAIKLPIGTWTCSQNDIPTLISVDMTLLHTLPRKDLGVLVRVSTPFPNPLPNGFPGPKEHGTLRHLEDYLDSTLTARRKTLWVAHHFQAGTYAAFFYAPPDVTGWQETLDELHAGLPPGLPRFAMKLMVLNDPEWKGYRESLYPNPMGMTEILTVQTVRMMQAGGDDVTRSRPVRHWSSFKSSTDAASFVDRVAREGYSRISSTENPSLERPFVVIVGRDDALDPRFSRDSVGWLFNRASECGGKYDGWQAENLSQPSTGAAWGMTT